MRPPGFRISEWLLLAFFGYAALLIPWFPDRPRLRRYPIVLFAFVCSLIAAVACGEKSRFARRLSYFRDWLPLGLTLLAFSEMKLFVPRQFTGRREASWIRWDDRFLVGWRARSCIESMGKTIPFYLEFCYLLVYGVAAYCVAILYVTGKRSLVDRFLTIYLTGTLPAYALFPYFPSQPPRTLFPAVAAPSMTSWVCKLNWKILDSTPVQSGVFPSAHVSSAFSAAWAMLLLFPRRKLIGGGLVVYASSVSLATIYGRYHYIADVVAGFGISLVAGAICLLFRKRRRGRVISLEISKPRNRAGSVSAPRLG
ncbi:MAG TPA: phosphatase PAP2 family protein [Bryobacteraceae bacterium]